MKIGAVLPLCVTGSYGVDDLGRSEILFKSLDAFMQSDFFDPFYVVTPENEQQIVINRIADRWERLNIQIVGEDAFIPELSKYPKMRGWRKQQLIKIAAANAMKDQFYVTFDADVFCVKPLEWSDLIVDGKAVLQQERRSRHPKWWKASSRILNVDERNCKNGDGMSVTPAVLSVDITKKLISELNEYGSGNWVDNLCSEHNPLDPRNWNFSHFIKIKWTEYSLYYVCGYKHNLIEKYHVKAGTEKVPQIMFSVEGKPPIENWDTGRTFSSKNPGLFCIIGSKNRIPPDVVWKRIEPYFPKIDNN